MISSFWQILSQSPLIACERRRDACATKHRLGRPHCGWYKFPNYSKKSKIFIEYHTLPLSGTGGNVCMNRILLTLLNSFPRCNNADFRRVPMFGCHFYLIISETQFRNTSRYGCLFYGNSIGIIHSKCSSAFMHGISFQLNPFSGFSGNRPDRCPYRYCFKHRSG